MAAAYRVAAPSIRIVPWAALASCWPLPQQLLPVSATGGGRRRCFGHNLRKIILVFVNLENLRIFQIYFFTGGAVKANGIARFHRSAALPKEAALQMQLTTATLPVKREPRSVCGRSGVPKS